MKNRAKSYGRVLRLFLAGSWLMSAFFIWQLYGEDSKILNVPTVSQLPQTYWCWAATSEAVLRYTQNAPGMCSIADWARQQNKWGNDDCCANGTGNICNQANWMYGVAGSIEKILSHWGADSERHASTLSLHEVQDAIKNDSPLIVRWGWTSGGGHFVVLYGYSDSNMSIMDPWSGPTILTYTNVSSTATRTWTNTLVVRPKKVTLVIDDTGSMWDDIASAKDTLHNTINGFRAAGRFVKYSLITYKDDVSFPGSTISHDEIDGWVTALSAWGGGDCPEEGYGALDIAAEKAPKSEIWWMTDADSHGGFFRMLATRARLILAGCTLNSTILGSCSGSAAVTAMMAGVHGQGNTVPFSGLVDQRAGGLNTAAAMSLAATTGTDLSSYEAGESLSGGTDGLFFAVFPGDIANAVRLVLEEFSSTALIARSKLPAGINETLVPIDESVKALKIIIDSRTGAASTLSVRDPSGTTLTTSMDGVSEVIAGQSRMLLLIPPALKLGIFDISSSSTLDYLLDVSGDSEHSIELLGNKTVGLGQIMQVKVDMKSLAEPTGPAGPGPGGPGNPLPLLVPPARVLPFNPASLVFSFIRENGSSAQSVQLYDDGLHDDEQANDGIYGGTCVFNTAGSFRLLVTDGGIFLRMTTRSVISSTLAVTASASTVAPPGSTVTHTFTIANLSDLNRNIEVSCGSTAGWSDLVGIPSTITLAAGASKTVEIGTAIPPGAATGEEDVLSFVVVAQDDPSVFDSTAVSTVVTATFLPHISSFLPSRATAGDPGFMLFVVGSDFVDGAVVRWGASDRSTTFVNSSEVDAVIGADDLATGKTVQITVRNPDGEISNALNFSVSSFTMDSSPTSTTVAPGQSATYSIQLTPQFGSLDSPVSFSCTGLPSNCTASFLPTNVTPGNNVVTTTLTLATKAGSGSAVGAIFRSMGFVPPALGLILAILTLLSWLSIRKRISEGLSHRWLTAGALVCLIVLLASCGAVGNPPNTGTPKGTYQIMVKGISGNLSVSTNITLVVQ